MESAIQADGQSCILRTSKDLQAPRYFEPEQYATVCALCEAIVPADHECGGAIDSGVPEFLDLLVSENRRYQAIFTAGLDWLDSKSMRLFGCRYLECLSVQKMSLLDEIAFRREGAAEDGLEAAIRFLALLRKLTVGGFVTSRIGIEYLKYIGNEQLAEFPGCPVPAGWPGPAHKGEA